MDKKYNLALRRIRSINVNDLNKIVDGGDMASRIKNNIVNSSSFLGNGQKIVKSILQMTLNIYQIPISLMKK